MTTLRAKPADKIARIVFALVCFAVAVVCWHGHHAFYALFYGAFGCGMAVNAAVRGLSWISFDPKVPTLTIRKWPMRPVTIQPQDCEKLNSGRFSILTYQVNGRKHTYTIIGPYQDERVWAAYARRWLRGIKTKQAQQADALVQAIEDSTSEEDYNRRHKNRPSS